MTNLIQGVGTVIQVLAGAAYSAGDPIMVGDQGLVGFCIEDIASAATGSVLIPPCIIVDTPVKGHDGTSNAAIAIGDMVHFIAGDAFMDVTVANKTVGYALEAVGSGSTTTVQVAMYQGAGDLRA